MIFSLRITFNRRYKEPKFPGGHSEAVLHNEKCSLHRPLLCCTDFGSFCQNSHWKPHFGVNTNSGQRPVWSGGVDASNTVGRTTWNGGVTHTTDFRNGMTQVRGGFEKEFGQRGASLFGGANFNIDNHGRTSHGANVGLKIPFK
ncbi:hypothetical protein PRIPAC_84167 [Pristionchus pacificus]|uniref:Uncharacterized protein n=1 Tax=Pristionchus pacificus TaxID=54126 RepID=A0A2A6BTS0_PRIPA|nr:hypothetical protein PRIPAC_84167 [Pristionchus pacificus]|eukprot:PDM69288.1 hypothetical protein PRIPAC_47590 [Pristionchus pacificus]